MAWDPKQIAKYFRVGKHKVYAWWKAGELEMFDVSNPDSPRRQLRATDDAIKAFIEKRTLKVEQNELPEVEEFV